MNNRLGKRILTPKELFQRDLSKTPKEFSQNETSISYLTTIQEDILEDQGNKKVRLKKEVAKASHKNDH